MAKATTKNIGTEAEGYYTKEMLNADSGPRSSSNTPTGRFRNVSRAVQDALKFQRQNDPYLVRQRKFDYEEKVAKEKIGADNQKSLTTNRRGPKSLLSNNFTGFNLSGNSGKSNLGS